MADFEMIGAAMRPDNLLRMRVRSKTLSRFRPLDQLEDGEDETYDVDLDVPELVWRVGGKVRERGPTQVIGSHAADKTWLWGWSNASLPATAYGQIAPEIQAIPEIAELVLERRFVVDDASGAHQLATWLAARTGWLGAYPHENGEGNFVFMAFKPALPGRTFDAGACDWPAKKPWYRFGR